MILELVLAGCLLVIGTLWLGLLWPLWREISNDLVDRSNDLVNRLVCFGIIWAALVLTGLMLGFGLSLAQGVYVRVTIAPERRVVTVKDVKTVTRMQTNITLVGKSPLVMSVPITETEFATEEIPGRFSVSGRREWRDGSRVPLDLYLRDGKLVDYEVK